MNLRFAILFAAILVSGSEGGKRSGKRRLGGGKKSGSKAESGNSLGAWTVTMCGDEPCPLHKTKCGDHICRPGEGNLKGYGHWSQPYKQTDVPKDAPKYVPGWTNTHFPAERYVPLVTLAKERQRDGIIIFTAADFDYREHAENWWLFTQRAGVPNALVHSLDNEAYDYFRSKNIPAANGTGSMDAWLSSRLQRHIQRALAERHMAAAALVHARLSVLMMDSTAVLVRDPMPYLRGAPGDISAMRGGCRPDKFPAGCEPMWNLLFLRATAEDEQRARVLAYIKSSIDKGLVDFYLRWWMGHHCIEMGYNKLFNELRPQLALGMTPADAAAAKDEPTLITVRGYKGLQVALLPKARFPNAFEYPNFKETAFVGRVVRPEKDPKRTHRLRLDRYDEVDFDEMRQATKAMGFWLLGNLST